MLAHVILFVKILFCRFWLKEPLNFVWTFVSGVEWSGVDEEELCWREGKKTQPNVIWWSFFQSCLFVQRMEFYVLLYIVYNTKTLVLLFIFTKVNGVWDF